MEHESLSEAALEAGANVTNESVHELYYQDPKFWVAVAFVLFVVVAAKFIWPFIARALDKRADAIKDQLEAAARLQLEAEELLESYKREHQLMLAEAETILENAKRDADLIRSKAADELKANLARRAAQAEETIARAQTDAVAQLRAQLVENASAQARDVVAAQLKAEKNDPAFDRALAAIASQIH